MMIGEGHTRTRSLIFWGTRFDLEDRKVVRGSTSSTSVLRFLTRRRKRYGKRFEAGTLHLRSDKTIEDLSRMFNLIVRGWLQYYGQFYRSALYPPMRQLDRSLARWAARKYKKLRGHLRRATHWVARISRRDPKLWRTGRWVCGKAPWREPYELRGSSTVLREPRGETPRGYSPHRYQQISRRENHWPAAQTSAPWFVEGGLGVYFYGCGLQSGADKKSATSRVSWRLKCVWKRLQTTSGAKKTGISGLISKPSDAT
jgi:hypothetical protein